MKILKYGYSDYLFLFKKIRKMKFIIVFFMGIELFDLLIVIVFLVNNVMESNYCSLEINLYLFFC